MHTLRDNDFDTLTVGMKAYFKTKIKKDDLDVFGKVFLDQAPVHRDVLYAQACGYIKPISYGLFVASYFSGLIGMILPGPRSVIHSLTFSMRKPVYEGDVLTYSIQIKKIVKSVRVVFLDLSVIRDPNDTVLKGETRCGFLR